MRGWGDAISSNNSGMIRNSSLPCPLSYLGMGVAIRSLLGVDIRAHLSLVPLCGVEFDCCLLSFLGFFTKVWSGK